MGVGMSVICAPEDVVAVRDALFAEGFDTFEMGKVVAGTGKVVYE
jgi:phosphoribosylformylglycinamidine cyclo-ligase